MDYPCPKSGSKSRRKAGGPPPIPVAPYTPNKEFRRPPGIRVCNSCKRTEEETAFRKVGAQCAECRYAHECERLYNSPESTARRKQTARAYKLKSVYGITESVFRDMLKTQKGRCATCRVKFQPKGKFSVCIDHRKSDGAVRGLLCRNCNLALGLLYDSSTTLQNLIAYLARSKK